MNVLHFGTLYAHAGGPATSTYLTLQGLRQHGVDAKIAMYHLSSDDVLRGNDVPIIWCKKPWEGRFAYSPCMKRELRGVENIDIYHAQGIWQYPTYALCDAARQLGKPYLITPRGMLYPQDISKSHKTFKLLSLRLRLLSDLNSSACVHVTCEEEMNVCRDIGVVAPIAVIPNPAETKDYMPKAHDGIFRLGYLGRLSPRKNVEMLIRAFANPTLKEAELVIIGGGDSHYEKFLHQEVSRLGLKNVVFKGFLNGQEKDETLATISVLAMPSGFENMGNVVLEALARGIPCIATTGSPWRNLQDFNCGWWVNCTQDDIEEAILKAFSTPQTVLDEMGESGRKLVSEKYSVDSVASKMKILYEWILHKSEQPSFVFTNDV